MKVAHILYSIEYSGAEIMLNQASDIFDEQNISTTLVACSSKAGLFEPAMLQKGYTIHRTNTSSKFQLIKHLYKYFRENKFDVVHIHTEALFLWIVVILKLTNHHNIVRTYHNCWTFTGLLRFKRIIHRRLTVWMGVKNHAIGIAVSKNEKGMFLNDTVIINNWIKTDSEIIKGRSGINERVRKQLGIKLTDFVMITIGGCSSVKNHTFVIGVLEKLIIKNMNVIYLHVGTGKDENKEKQMADTLNLNSNIIFTGNRNNIPELLIASDLYLMPSIFEGLSIANLEAMYYNGVVIVNDAPGLNNLVRHNKTGYILNINNEDKYLEKIEELYNNKEDISDIKNAARSFVLNNFSMEKNVSKLLSFYKSEF
jgi:glycosyltransferase involved in cell wall biosynthesis